VLSVAGIVVASYLTWVHYDLGSLVCGLGDCHSVQASEFATIGPVPVALLGLGMYVAVLACTLLGQVHPQREAMATGVAFAGALAGAVYAVYLTWIEVAVIEAICQWCVASAVLTFALAVVEGATMWCLLGAPIADDSETGIERAA